MGLGKTPTVLAHLAGPPVTSPALVVAPAAVVGTGPGRLRGSRRDCASSCTTAHRRSSADGLVREIRGRRRRHHHVRHRVRDIDALTDVTWGNGSSSTRRSPIKNSSSETAQQLRRISARTRLALTGTPIENGLGDLWSILDFTNPGLVGPRPMFIAQMSGDGEEALRALNGILLFRRTKSEPEVAAGAPDKIDELDHCTMTPEQIGLYQAVLDDLGRAGERVAGREPKQGAILAAITALKQICNHPAAYRDDGQPLAGRSGKLARSRRSSRRCSLRASECSSSRTSPRGGDASPTHLTEVTGVPIAATTAASPAARATADRRLPGASGPGALVLSLKAGGTGLNLTAANHVVLYDRWWNPRVEDQARDRRGGSASSGRSSRTASCARARSTSGSRRSSPGKRHIANLVLPKSSSIADLDAEQLRVALGLRPDELITD
jgi:hypothetical protein